MEHVYFFLLNFALFFAILLIDRKKWKTYALLSLFTLVAAFIFENFTVFIGLWYYHSEPKVLFLSLYTWLLYVPYINFCYFLSNKLVKNG